MSDASLHNPDDLFIYFRGKSRGFAPAHEFGEGQDIRCMLICDATTGKVYAATEAVLVDKGSKDLVVKFPRSQAVVLQFSTGAASLTEIVAQMDFFKFTTRQRANVAKAIPAGQLVS